MIDIEALTLGEVSLIEKLSGQSISALGDDSAPKGNTLAALALITKRRSGEPGFTWNQAQALSFAEAQEILGITEDEDAEEPEEPEGYDAEDPTEP